MKKRTINNNIPKSGEQKENRSLSKYLNSKKTIFDIRKHSLLYKIDFVDEWIIQGR